MLVMPTRAYAVAPFLFLTPLAALHVQQQDRDHRVGTFEPDCNATIYARTDEHGIIRVEIDRGAAGIEYRPFRAVLESGYACHREAHFAARRKGMPSPEKAQDFVFASVKMHKVASSSMVDFLASCGKCLVDSFGLCREDAPDGWKCHSGIPHSGGWRPLNDHASITYWPAFMDNMSTCYDNVPNVRTILLMRNPVEQFISGLYYFWDTTSTGYSDDEKDKLMQPSAMRCHDFVTWVIPKMGTKGHQTIMMHEHCLVLFGQDQCAEFVKDPTSMTQEAIDRKLRRHTHVFITDSKNGSFDARVSQVFLQEYGCLEPFPHANNRTGTVHVDIRMDAFSPDVQQCLQDIFNIDMAIYTRAHHLYGV